MVHSKEPFHFKVDAVVPTVILAYKFATFPAPSVLQSQFPAAFHQYFGGSFVIGEFRDWREFGTSLNLTQT
jgi:hypothetical protein